MDGLTESTHPVLHGRESSGAESPSHGLGPPHFLRVDHAAKFNDAGLAAP